MYQHGYVSLGAPYYNPNPDRFTDEVQQRQTGVIIAPFWVEAELGATQIEDSVVYYDTFKQWSLDDDTVPASTVRTIARVSADVSELTSDTSFRATGAILVTWYNLRPVPYNVNGDEVSGLII